MIMNNQCPRCYEGVLLRWAELSDEEKEIVKRLPPSVDYATPERESSHRWCTRCWHEITTGETMA